MAARTKRVPIPFRFLASVDEVPANGFHSPYELVFRRVLKDAPRFVRLKCGDEASAKSLRDRLTAASKGRLTVRLPSGGATVYVGMKPAPKPRVKAIPRHRRKARR